MRMHLGGRLPAPYARGVEIRFPGGLRVDAEEGGFRIPTDQPAGKGGDGTAPSPFHLFLASIGTCAGFYALQFCRQRSLTTEGLALSLDARRDAAGRHVSTVVLHLTLPAGFPERYRGAIVRAMEQCSVKRHLADPPEIAIAVGVAEPLAAAVPA